MIEQWHATGIYGSNFIAATGDKEIDAILAGERFPFPLDRIKKKLY